MDAASQKTFDKLRPGKDGQSKFQTIIDGMKELAKIKRGELGFSFLIRTEADGFGIESNIDEIFDAAILAKKIGCDYIEYKPSYSFANGATHALVKHSSERMNEARSELSKLKSVEDDNFKIIFAINLQDSLNGVEQPQIKNYHFCPSAYFRTLITPSGIYVCPYWRGKKSLLYGGGGQQILTSENRKKIMDQLDPSFEI